MINAKLEKKNRIEDLLGSKARVKILALLAKENELNISSIIRKTHLNHSIVVKHLKKLIAANLAQEKKFGRIRIYRFKTENLKARSLKNFIEIWEK
ncbi:MAG: ArsR family transcriptional regulator [Promethearchaeota archaeon]|nr:MAG: ArsR family transcriptional regulator [Candidatus Lokiarchaeota archaeon]